MCRLSWNLGASTSWNTWSLSRPVMGLLYFYLYLCTFMITFRSVFLRIRSFSERKLYRKSKHAFWVQRHFFSWKSWRLWDNLEGCGKARHTTDNNITRCIALHALQIRLQTHSELTHQTTYTLNKIQFMASINLLHVSVLGCHPQGLKSKTVYDLPLWRISHA